MRRTRCRRSRCDCWRGGGGTIRPVSWRIVREDTPSASPDGVRRNLERLLDLLTDDTDNDRLMRAEVLRELGDFAAAKQALREVSTELAWVVEQIRRSLRGQGHPCSQAGARRARKAPAVGARSKFDGSLPTAKSLPMHCRGSQAISITAVTATPRKGGRRQRGRQSGGAGKRGRGYRRAGPLRCPVRYAAARGTSGTPVGATSFLRRVCTPARAVRPGT